MPSIIVTKGRDILYRYIFPDDTEFIAVGRHPHAHILIPDPIVSRRHLLLKPHGKHWRLTTFGPRAKVVIADIDVRDYYLSPGESFDIGPYSFFLMRNQDVQRVSEEARAENSTDGVMLEEDRDRFLKSNVPPGDPILAEPTKVIDIEALLKQSQASAFRRKGALQVMDKSGAVLQRVLLDKPRVIIGKTDDCDIRYKGLFAPKLAAAVEWLGDCHWIRIEPEVDCVINGVKAVGFLKLPDGCRIEVAGLRIEFSAPYQLLAELRKTLDREFKQMRREQEQTLGDVEAAEI
ncbi:MAG: hypothetical protein GMKNLPBB_00562 [Myxococcota bacterium]|nr:hypothetical protein [Myxococcota bacterium]